MAFTDSEMAVLTQLSYADVPPHSRLEPYTLYDFMTESSGREILKDRFDISYNPITHKYYGSQYAEVINGMLEKSKDGSYVIADSINDSASDLQAFSVREPDGAVTIAVRGTELSNGIPHLVNDLVQDAELGVLGTNAQEKALTNFAQKQLSDGATELNLTGHSLGGYDALSGAVRLDNPDAIGRIVIFNAPNGNLFYEVNHQDQLSKLSPKLTVYQNENDFVSSVNYADYGEVIITSDTSSGLLDAHNVKHMPLDSDGNFITSPNGKNSTVLQELFEKGSAIVTLFGTIFAVGGYAFHKIQELSEKKNQQSTYSVSGASLTEFYMDPAVMLTGDASPARSAIGDTIGQLNTILARPIKGGTVWADMSVATDPISIGILAGLNAAIVATRAEIEWMNHEMRKSINLLEQIEATLQGVEGYMQGTGEVFQQVESQLINTMKEWHGRISSKK